MLAPLLMSRRRLVALPKRGPLGRLDHLLPPLGFVIGQRLLAQAMGLYRSGALRLTDWLTAQGWAERRNEPADAQSWGLHLTAAGRRSLNKLEQAVRAHDEALLKALNGRGAGLKPDLEWLAGVATAAAQALPQSNSRSNSRQGWR